MRAKYAKSSFREDLVNLFPENVMYTYIYGLLNDNAYVGKPSFTMITTTSQQFTHVPILVYENNVMEQYLDLIV